MKNNLPNIWIHKENIFMFERRDFENEVEFTPKEKLEESERNYREMFKTMTASVEGYKARLEIAVRALKYCANKEAYYNALDGGPWHVSDIFKKSREALKELGEAVVMGGTEDIRNKLLQAREVLEELEK